MANNETDSLTTNETALHPLFSIRKSENQMEVSLQLLPNKSAKLKNFLMIQRETGEKTTFDAIELSDGSYGFCLSLFDVIAVTEKRLIKKHFEFYFSLELERNGKTVVEDFPLSLNFFERFDSVDLAKSTINGNTVIPYFSRKTDILCLGVNVPIRGDRFIQHHALASASVSKESLSVSGSLFTKAFSINKLNILMVGRQSGNFQAFDIEPKLDKSKREKHLYHYTYDFSLLLKKFALDHFIKNKRDEDIDFYLSIQLNGLYQPTIIPLSQPIQAVSKNFNRDFPISYGKSTAVFSFYFGGDTGTLTLAITMYDKETYAYYQESAPIAFFAHPFYQRKNIWILADSPFEKNGNAWYLFCYLREHHPEISAYYILNQDDYNFEQKLKSDKEAILLFKSKDYIQMLLAAKVLLTSDVPYAIYPSRSPLAIDFIRAKHVLMNQSILGLNNQNQLLGYQTKLFRNDLLLVSSKTEARYVHQTLGYPEKQIKRTGLPKFDQLLLPIKPTKLKRRLLLLPEKIKTGPYNPRNEAGQSAERFLSLLNDNRFKQFITEHELEIAIVLPSSLDPFAAAFAVTDTQIFFEEDTDLFDLFKTSLLLITDTDARAFDFAFLEKPILFYQPETTSQVFSPSVSLRQTFSNELPGEVAATKEDLLHLLDLLAENLFVISRKNRQKMDALLENHDTDSAERVVQAVQAMVK